MTMRKRVLSIRLADAEYQALKQQANAAGTSVPLHVRRLALDSIQITPRLDSLEQTLKGMPDRAMLVEVAQRLGAKIDRAGAGKGGAA